MAGPDHEIIIFVPNYMALCEMLESDYMELYGGNDGSCLYAPTDDGKGFDS
ncbi:MAG: hypothetical protein IKI64_06550 [Clostridia bacterium]|nr:hypothetical protein [Clostridia bacterium]